MPTTVLVLTRDLLARADFAGGALRAPTALHRADAAGAEQLEALAERAALPGGRLRGRVFVLTDAVFSQTVELDLRALRDAPEPEVRRALSYETQLLSGIPAAELMLAWREVEEPRRGARTAWVTAAPAWEVAELARRIETLGGRFAGLAHVAAVPRPLVADPGSDWTRVEHWHDARAELTGRGPRAVALRVGAPEATHRGRDRRTGPGLETLLAPTIGAHVEPDDPAPLSLADDDVLQRWVSAWAEELLARRSGAAPVVRPPRAPLGASTAATLGLLVAALVVWVAWRDFDTLRSEHVELVPRLTDAMDRSERSERLRSDLQAARTRATELAAAAAKPAAAPAEPGVGPRLVERVMDLLTTATPEDLCVQRFDASARGVSVHGTARRPLAVELLARRIGQALEGDSLLVSHVTHELAPDGPDLGLYRFGIDLSPRSRAAAPSAQETRE